MRRLFALGAWSFMCLTLGYVAAVVQTGDLVPIRDASGLCQAFDTSRGEILGSFSSTGGRCHIRDWRLRHPLG